MGQENGTEAVSTEVDETNKDQAAQSTTRPGSAVKRDVSFEELGRNWQS